MEETSTQTSLGIQQETTNSGRTKFDSTVDAFISYIRSLSHFWFTHIILILVLAGYTFGGAYLFHYFEYDARNELMVQASQIRNKVMGELWEESQITNKSKSSWILSFKTKMSGYQTYLCCQNVWMDENINGNSWSLFRAVFYCGTVFTATGYGNIVTTTETGQILTIIYTVIGIPYTLTVLLDIGSVLTNGLRRAYIDVYKMYYFGCFCWKGVLQNSKHHINYLNIDQPIKQTTSVQLTVASTSTYTTDVEEPKEKLFLLTGLKKSDFVIPVWVGFVLILVYTFLGALVFIHYESWTYAESLYFIIVSLTTIGFGDYVPKYTSYALTFFYIIIGLALVSLFFNLIVERISKAMRKARRRFKKRLRKDGYKTDLSENPLSSTEDKGNGKVDHQSVITVQLLDTMKNSRQIRSTPQPKTTPIILLRISDSNLLKYVQFDKKLGKQFPRKLPEAYISDKYFMKYLKEKIELKKRLLSLT